MCTDDTYKRYAEQEERRKKLAAELRQATKAKLFDALRSAGVARATVIFDGQGDGGQIEDVTFETSAGKPIDLSVRLLRVETAKPDGSGPEKATLPIREVIENLCYELLEEQHAGWEINEGAFGEFVFDLTDRTLTLTFNWRVTDVETSIETF